MQETNEAPPQCILFPGESKIGLRQDNKLFFFKAGTVQVESSYTFPFTVLFFSLPVQNVILVVDESRPNTLLLWNHHTSSIENSLDFESNITNLICTRNFASVVIKTSTTIVKIKPFSVYQAITTTNPIPTFSIINLPTDNNHCTYAYPDESKPTSVIISTIPSSDDSIIIDAHKNKISCLALSQDAKYLVTASDYGTIVRLWDAKTGKFIHESRRGWTSATIIHFSFSPLSNFLCISSSHGTIHVCKIDKSSNEGNWLIPKADISVNIRRDNEMIQLNRFQAFVEDDTNLMCCVTESGHCIVYEIDLDKGNATMKTKFKLDKIMKLTNSNV
ncbi:WD repeat domain phosphoinositide-interacting protein 3 isoform X4 [Histomonas meleagridis]|uniref:WD repeat domain phosphoinositide-interacting protein 3 isoform X4 n=1 Tax=Histomonas meleagridis TaxID=135588 RepID=UPI003559B8F1|nr:WD repeat domain phosphoinositide-interacting protein 3 isoform X4 [Histomonas meleagridis]KAH0805051.1 WD repeat domain phosphoinositide-interacting protein 3 isoform X4 [Histomonas meleagridis]